MVAAIADVRPEERRGAAGAFLTLFGILAAHTLLETARDALFLARLPPAQLPWVYLAIAGLAVVISQGRGPSRFSGVRALSLLLLSCAVVTFAFWALGSWTSPWMLRALYVWSGLVGTLSGLQFWLLLSELYTITQAKRVYKLIGLGSLLGAVAGAGLARLISVHWSPPQLVLASAVLLASTGLAAAVLLRAPEGGRLAAGADRGRTTLVDAVQLLRAHPYLTRLAFLVLVSTIALTLADYVFKSAVARSVPREELGTFFATFYMALNALALVAQLLLMGWLLREFGLHRALWVLPGLVFLGAAGVAFGGGLLAALLLKGADGTLRHSVHRTGTELLYLPIPDLLRSRAKPLIDVIGQRGGQALASVLILAELSLERGDTVLAAASALLSVVWIAWVAELRPHYLELFRSALREGTMKDRVDLPQLDLGSLEVLIAALNSRGDAEVVGAMDLLVAEGRVRLIPALVLYHPSRPVVLRALEILEKSGREDFVPVADRLMSSGDEEVRAAALRARTSARPEEAVLQVAATDPSPLVRATALAGLVSGGWVSEETRRTLEELLVRGSAAARAALARAIQRQPAPAFEEALLRLAQAPQAEVQVEVAHAMGAVRSERFLPDLLSMLAFREVRGAARAALRTHGPRALQFLDEALGDSTLPHEIRRHLPRTVSQFPPAEAAPVLLKDLLQETDGMVRYKILRGLGRIAADHPEVDLDARALREATERTLEAAFRLIHWRLTLERGAAEEPRRATPGHELLAALLRDKEVHAIERLFRLLGLQFRGEDFRRIYRGLRNTNPKVRASSRELLENLVAPPLRDAVLALVDDAHDAERLVRGRHDFRSVPLDYETLMTTLLEQPSESLRCIAAYHVGELGLTALRGRLESYGRRETGFFVSRVIERALRLLTNPEERRLAHAR